MVEAFIVLLGNNKFIVLREEWIEYPILSANSKVFYSSNRQSNADFSIEQKYYFHRNETSCYMAYICKRFSKCDYFLTFDMKLNRLIPTLLLVTFQDTEREAERYLKNRKPRVSRWLNHRRVCPRSPQIIETMEIISESSDDEVFDENESDVVSKSSNEGLNRNKLSPTKGQLKIILDRNEVKSLLEIHENSPHKDTSSGFSGVPEQVLIDER